MLGSPLTFPSWSGCRNVYQTYFCSVNAYSKGKQPPALRQLMWHIFEPAVISSGSQPMSESSISLLGCSISSRAGAYKMTLAVSSCQLEIQQPDAESSGDHYKAWPPTGRGTSRMVCEIFLNLFRRWKLVGQEAWEDGEHKVSVSESRGSYRNIIWCMSS